MNAGKELSRVERLEIRAEFEDLVKSADAWATSQSHPFRNDYLCAVMYVRDILAGAPAPRLDELLRACREARRLRTLHANAIAIVAALGGVAIAVCGLVFSAGDPNAKSDWLVVVCVVVGVITLWQGSQRFGYDRERIREREWNSVAVAIQAQKAALRKEHGE